MSIAFVQQNNVNLAASTTPSLAYTSSPNAGNLLLAHISWTGTTTTISSVQDTFVDAFSPIISIQTATRLVSLYAAIAASSGPNTVQFNLSASQASVIQLVEFSGALLTTDGTATTNGSSGVTSTSCGPIVPTQNGDLLISFVLGGLQSAGTPGWIFTAGPSQAGYQYLIQGNAASATALYTQTTSQYAIDFAAFKAISPPPTVVPTAGGTAVIPVLNALGYC